MSKADVRNETEVVPAFTRKAEILKHARRMFAENGYDATSIEDICQSSGIGRGLIYHYFKSKDELLRTIHANIFRPLMTEYVRIYDEGGSPRHVLRTLSRMFVKTMSEHPDEAVVWGRESKALRTNVEYWNEVRTNRRVFLGILEKTIQSGIDQGAFRSIDLRIAALAWTNLMEHSYTWFKAGGRLTSDELADALIDIFLGGISVPAERTTA